jgi:ABC-type lipoprotein release transport system permease subunit
VATPPRGTTPTCLAWFTTTTTTSRAAAVALLASLLPARLALRQRPVQLAGLRE